MSKRKYLLYEFLNKKETEKYDWKIVCSNIQKLKHENLEIIFSLIVHHYFLNQKNTNILNDSKFVKHIYNCKVLGKNSGVFITVENLPKTLQDIICKYVNILISSRKIINKK